jgi:hypothetical protein
MSPRFVGAQASCATRHSPDCPGAIGWWSLHELILASSLLFVAALVVGVVVPSARAWTLWRTFRRFRRTLNQAAVDMTSEIDRVTAHAASVGEHTVRLTGAVERLTQRLAEAQVLARAAATAWRPLAKARAFVPGK